MVRQFENSQNVAKALIRSMSAGQYSPKTLAYIGANLDDMAGAMRVFSLQ